MLRSYLQYYQSFLLIGHSNDSSLTVIVHCHIVHMIQESTKTIMPLFEFKWWVGWHLYRNNLWFKYPIYHNSNEIIWRGNNWSNYYVRFSVRSCYILSYERLGTWDILYHMLFVSIFTLKVVTWRSYYLLPRKNYVSVCSFYPTLSGSKLLIYL